MQRVSCMIPQESSRCTRGGYHVFTKTAPSFSNNGGGKSRLERKRRLIRASGHVITGADLLTRKLV